jgi:hypothetical protein
VSLLKSNLLLEEFGTDKNNLLLEELGTDKKDLLLKEPSVEEVLEPGLDLRPPLRPDEQVDLLHVRHPQQLFNQDLEKGRKTKKGVHFAVQSCLIIPLKLKVIA